MRSFMAGRLLKKCFLGYYREPSTSGTQTAQILPGSRKFPGPPHCEQSYGLVDDREQVDPLGFVRTACLGGDPGAGPQQVLSQEVERRHREGGSFALAADINRRGVRSTVGICARTAVRDPASG